MIARGKHAHTPSIGAAPLRLCGRPLCVLHELYSRASTVTSSSPTVDGCVRATRCFSNLFDRRRGWAPTADCSGRRRRLLLVTSATSRRRTNGSAADIGLQIQARASAAAEAEHNLTVSERRHGLQDCLSCNSAFGARHWGRGDPGRGEAQGAPFCCARRRRYR
jgi:hypothetical protein